MHCRHDGAIHGGFCHIRPLNCPWRYLSLTVSTNIKVFYQIIQNVGPDLPHHCPGPPEAGDSFRDEAQRANPQRCRSFTVESQLICNGDNLAPILTILLDSP